MKGLITSAIAAVLLTAGCMAEPCDGTHFDLPVTTARPDAGPSPDSGEEPDAGPPCVPTQERTFRGDVQPLLQRCTLPQCHPMFGEPTARSLFVEVPGADCTDGRKIVKPGQPDHSYLLDKLTGRNLCSGFPMPLLAAPLRRNELDTIADWICAGAKDD